mgnify:FL=1
MKNAIEDVVDKWCMDYYLNKSWKRTRLINRLIKELNKVAISKDEVIKLIEALIERSGYAMLIARKWYENNKGFEEGYNLGIGEMEEVWHEILRELKQ